ncbi:hypothetical protein [Labrenzia sp. DG1229]|uniref:hypothetical protein n=1 Tax=Labrenzia sp. DG1229 TaxID=681847 RepID=UPI00048BDA82|nr:hypothetical protein [Labrenzia sp. DG1229]
MRHHLTSTRSRRLRRIQLGAGLMKWAVSTCVLVLIILTVLLVLSVLFPQVAALTGEQTISIGDSERAFAALSLVQRSALTIVALCMFTLSFGALWTLRSLCMQFQSLEFFSARSLKTVVSLGTWLICCALFEFASDPLASLVVTMDYPAGERIIDVTVDGGEIFSMSLGALLLLFGWIMSEAALLAEENRQII